MGRHNDVLNEMDSAALDSMGSIVSEVNSYERDRETARLILDMHKTNPAAAKAAYNEFMEQKKREAEILSSPPEAGMLPVNNPR
ncbi:TPA: hypothetical protein NJ338_004550 [Vibrio parahaemolyticus]|nr:hypothetical protein [Vibrio vulnificus]EJG1876539.1 hypothetical protein [Vibrio parahaemolyticus]MBM4851095.1 hypothetical protein [Vibrio parahaemolyticus]HBH7866979.1 hypothetical protein [Vibrio parahaemolyticus]HCE3084477.1 hypothetical protein [Vibrio parahaemolyticus]